MSAAILDHSYLCALGAPSWSKEVLSTSEKRHFEFLWAWFVILQHLRHQKKSAWAPQLISENRLKNSNPFQRYRTAAFADPTFYITKIRLMSAV